MMFFAPAPKLIIGEHSALYVFKGDKINLQNPQDLSSLKNKSAVDIFLDFPGAHYKVYKYPKLSRFELKQAIQNHPDLQDKTLLSASAFITKKGKLNLCTLRKSDILTPWLEALSDHTIPVKSLKSLPFIEALKKDSPPTKATYWITKTLDKKARHICLLKGAVIFVRYTTLTKAIEAEIKKTLQFIQRDYALDRADITIQNHLQKEEDITSKRPSKMLHWYWLNRLPKNLSTSFKNLHRAQRRDTLLKMARVASLALLILSSGLFFKETLSYYFAQRAHENLIQSYQTLPPPLRSLPLEKLQQILWLTTHDHTPFQALEILQKQGDKSLRLEEFHWQVTGKTTQRLRLSLKHNKHLQRQDQADHLEVLFKASPTLISSDDVVDRFEIILTKGDEK